MEANLLNEIIKFSMIPIITAFLTISLEKFFSYLSDKNKSYRDFTNEAKVKNILDGYHHFMELLPAIFEKIEYIYNNLGDYMKYYKYEIDLDINIKEQTSNSVIRNLYALDKIIHSTDKFTADLLYFDEKSLDKFIEFSKYILESNNAKDKDYVINSRKKLVLFLKTFSKNFSPKKNKEFKNINWFIEPMRYNVLTVDKELINNDEIKRYK